MSKETITFNYATLEKSTLESSQLGIEIDHKKTLKKLADKIILQEVLNILKDKKNYNLELSKNNPDYRKANHAFNKVNELMITNDLHKSTEKLIKVTAKVLLLNTKVIFSNFIKDFKDLDNFNKFSTWYSDSDLASNMTFNDRIIEINKVIALQGDLHNDKIIVPKQKRQIIGKYTVTVAGSDYNLMVLLKEYKLSKLSIEDFGIVHGATMVALKEYYELIK